MNSKNHFLTFFSFICIFLSNASSSADLLKPNEKAAEMARRQDRVQTVMRKLIAEAHQIHDSTLKPLALQLLNIPDFKIIEARRSAEADILSKLKKEGLIDLQIETLFPTRTPMPFIAAPGGPWTSHHAYPGGLAYHTYFNLRTGLNLAETYYELYGVNANKDWIRLSAIWHDSAKSFTLEWNQDGSCSPSEPLIAKTSAHHIWGVSEAAFRKLPPQFIVILASAHRPPMAGADQLELIGYLKAASIIAGVSFESVGLNKDGNALLVLPPIEAFINHIDDHDYVLSVESFRQVTNSLDAGQAQKSYWKRNETLSKKGDIYYYDQNQKAQQRKNK